MKKPPPPLSFRPLVLAKEVFDSGDPRTTLEESAHVLAEEIYAAPAWARKLFTPLALRLIAWNLSAALLWEQARRATAQEVPERRFVPGREMWLLGWEACEIAHQGEGCSCGCGCC